MAIIPNSALQLSPLSVELPGLVTVDHALFSDLGRVDVQTTYILGPQNDVYFDENAPGTPQERRSALQKTVTRQDVVRSTVTHVVHRFLLVAGPGAPVDSVVISFRIVAVDEPGSVLPGQFEVGVP